MTDASHPAPTRRRPHDRRAQIVAAAGELFARRGYQAVGMSDIADVVGVRASALYRHFAGKQELLHAVLEDNLVTLRGTLPTLELSDRDGTALRVAGFAM